MTDRFPIAADQLRAMTEPSADTISQHIGWLKQYIIGMTDANWADMRVRAERQLHELSAALRAQSDVRAPAPQGEPVAWRVELLSGKYQMTQEQELAGRWRKNDAIVEPLYAAPPPPTDLADVLENVREGIAKVQDTGNRVPIELHRACQALTHIVEGAGK